MRNLRQILALCLLFAQAVPLHAMNENTIGSAGALTRDQVLRLSALKYQMARRDPVKVLHKLTREERMRRSALRHLRKARHGKHEEIVPKKPETREEPLQISDKRAQPQFFFILERRPLSQGIFARI